MSQTTFRWLLLITANVLIWGVLSFYETRAAPPSNPKLPFANSIEQRGDIVRELRVVSDLLREQNALLRSGKLKVVVESPDR
jgi:hypothetical protein